MKQVLGKTEPRIWTKPLRKLTPKTTLGYSAIQYAVTVMNMTLDPWEEWALIHILEIVGNLETGNWRFRFRTVVVEVARQNGKTTLSKIIASYFLNVLGVQSIFGTSLSLEKAEEVWDAVVSEQESNPVLVGEIDTVARRNGGKKLILKGNRVYKVGAPTRRAGRGDSNDLVLLDELREQRDWETWSAAAASTVAKPRGLILCFTNAGDPDSIVLREVRSKAIAKIEGTKANDFGGNVNADALGLFEWSAPEKAETDDVKALAQANPALGYGRLTIDALMANRETFPESKFRAECMCQQVETILPEPFPEGAWLGGQDENSRIREDSELFWGIDMSQDRKYTVIAVCGMRAPKYGEMKLCFQGRGAPVSGLAEQICTIDGVTRMAQEGPDLSSGWNRFYDAVAACAPGDQRGGVKVYHLPQPALDTPGRTCQLRNLGGGIMLPDRTKSPDDISSLMAVAMAYAGATQISKKERKVYESSYASGNSLIFI